MSRAAKVIVAATGILLLGVVLVAFYFVTTSSAKTSRFSADGSCNNEAHCLNYEQLLMTTLNFSVNPCDDFTAFVASRWVPPAGQKPDDEWKVKWDPKYLFINLLKNEITAADSGSTHPLMRVAESYFVSCKDHTTKNPLETRKMFKQLLRNISIPWPERPPSGVDPLDAFFNLCIRFQVALWFDTKMAAGNSVEGRKAVYIAPTAPAKYLVSKYKDMRSEETVRRYISGMLKYFSDNDDVDNQEDISYGYKIFNITKDFASKLAAVTELKASIVVRLDEISQDMNVSTHRIIAPLNKYFHPKDAFVVDDFAVIKGKGIINAVRNLLQGNDATLVLSHLGWWMIEVYSPIVDRELFVTKYGDRNREAKIAPLFCTTQVESAFKIMLLANHVYLNFPPTMRADVDLLLNNVLEAATALYDESDLPASNKSHISQKIRKVRINLWPDEKYQSEKEIREIYAHVNGVQDSTLGFWITTRLATAMLIGTDAYFEEKRLPRSFADSAFSYDDVLNTVTMSMLAAHEPFFYSNRNLQGPNRGGPGAQFAKELLLAVGTEPLFNDTRPDFHRVDGTKGSTSTRMILSKPITNITNCLVAFRAFKAQNTSSFKVRDFSNYALFFISFCHTQSRLATDFDCNKELQGAAYFADVFQCKKGSRMNP